MPNPKSRLAGLTEEEQGLYENAIDFIASAGDDDWEASNHYSRVKDALESLATCRALINEVLSHRPTATNIHFIIPNELGGRLQEEVNGIRG